MPSFVRNFFYRLRHPEDKNAVRWILQNKSWKEVAKECKGYDNESILEKVKSAALKVKNGEALFERDSVLFYQPEYNSDLLNVLDEIANGNNHQLHLIDFGGSLGSVYFQYKEKLQKYNDVKWCVIEQPHFVEFGKKELETEQLKFYYNLKECIQNVKVNAILFSSVLSYLDDPFQLLNEVMSIQPEFIVIDKTLMVDSEKDLICRQEVPESIYKASYPCRILSKEKLIKFMSVNYDLKNEFNPYDTKQVVRIEAYEAVFSALVFKKNLIKK